MEQNTTQIVHSEEKLTPTVAAPPIKENPNYEKSAGAVLFREKEEKNLIKDKKTKKDKNKQKNETLKNKTREYLLLKYSFKSVFWSFCKGLIEKGETEEHTAWGGGWGEGGGGKI